MCTFHRPPTDLAGTARGVIGFCFRPARVVEFSRADEDAAAPAHTAVLACAPSNRKPCVRLLVGFDTANATTRNRAGIQCCLSFYVLSIKGRAEPTTGMEVAHSCL